MRFKELRPKMNWGTNRNYSDCIHLDNEHCLLYKCKLCKDVVHRDMGQCAFIDQSKLQFGDPDWEKAFLMKLEMFTGEPMGSTQMVAGDKVIPVGAPRARKALGSSPLDER